MKLSFRLLTDAYIFTEGYISVGNEEAILKSAEQAKLLQSKEEDVMNGEIELLMLGNNGNVYDLA